MKSLELTSANGSKCKCKRTTLHYQAFTKVGVHNENTRFPKLTILKGGATKHTRA